MSRESTQYYYINTKTMRNIIIIVLWKLTLLLFFYAEYFDGRDYVA